MARNSQQTNFQAHQRQAKKNSTRLTIAFLLGIFLSAFSYFLVTWLVVKKTQLGFFIGVWFGGKNPDGTANVAWGAIVFSSLTALISVAIILWGFYSKRNELQEEAAEDIASTLGAQKLPHQLNLRQQQYLNVVQEMAIASGLNCPTILYLPSDNSVNGFVTGGYDESVAISVSQGALDYLNREELQALVAHEFGHIHNRDVFLNNRLTAVLHGFFLIKELMTDRSNDTEDYGDDYYYDDDSDTTSFTGGHSFFGDNKHVGFGPSTYFGIWGLAIIAISAGTIFFGKILQSAFSRQREWLADAHAVQYTRNKDALIGVFSKAMALQHLKVMTPTVSDESAHFLFINYQNKWLSTHPPMEDRVERYGQKVFLDDIESLAYKLKQIKHEQEQSILKDKEIKGRSKNMMTQGGTLLSLADDGSDAAISDSPAQQRFIAEKFVPLLAIREYQNSLKKQPVASPKSAAHAVLAQFIQLSNTPLDKFAVAFKWTDDAKEAIEQKIESLDEQHPSTHIQTFLHQLEPLRKYTKKQTLLKEIQTIIKADKSFDLCEISYLLCLRGALQKKLAESERQLDFKQHEHDIALLLSVAANISHDEETVQSTNYELMKNESMPSLSVAYKSPKFDDTTIKTLYQSIQTLAKVKSIYRKALLGTIEKNMLIDGKLSTEQNHLLFALKRTMA